MIPMVESGEDKPKTSPIVLGNFKDFLRLHWVHNCSFSTLLVWIIYDQVGIVIFRTGDGYDLHEYYLQNQLFSSSLLAVIAQTKEMKNSVLFNLVQAGKILRGSGAVCNVLESPRKQKNS